LTPYVDSLRSQILRRDITAQMAALLKESLAIQVGSPDTDLIETGALDSMALVQLTHAIEERFGLKLPPMSELDVDAFRSVAAMTDLILDHRPESVDSVGNPPPVNGKPAAAPDAARLAVAGEIQSLLVTELSRHSSPQLCGLVAAIPLVGMFALHAGHRQGGAPLMLRVLGGYLDGMAAKAAFLGALALAWALDAGAWAWPIGLAAAAIALWAKHHLRQRARRPIDSRAAWLR